MYNQASVAQKLTHAPADAPQPPRRARGVVFEVDLDATVRDATTSPKPQPQPQPQPQPTPTPKTQPQPKPTPTPNPKPSRVPSSPSPAPCFKKGCRLGTYGGRLGCIWLQVREVFVKHRAAILGDDALGQHAQLAVMQVNLTLSQSPNLSLSLR